MSTSAYRLASLLALLITASAAASTVDAINNVRAHGCAGIRGVKRSLTHMRELDLAAERLASGDALHLALKRARYRATETASIHVGGATDDASLGAILKDARWCRQIVNPAVHDMGSFNRGVEVWIVLAAPFEPPPPTAQSAIAKRALKLVNDARAREQRCGFKTYPPVPPLRLSERLSEAALVHSKDMAAHDYFDHGGRDGTTPAQRVTAAGYQWRSTGENIASGMTEVEDAIAGWLQSPGHCQNLMSPRFSEMGIAFAASGGSDAEIYWTQEFAAPR